MLDFTSDLGAHAFQRLETEEVIWLTTVGPDGTPQPNPVWFLWANESFLIYTRPGSVKVRNIRLNPRVALHFNSDSLGENVVVFAGRARIEENVPAGLVTAYLEKYRDGIRRIQMTPASLLQTYSTPLSVTPQRLRGF